MRIIIGLGCNMSISLVFLVQITLFTRFNIDISKINT